jgi:hypothetical protein
VQERFNQFAHAPEYWRSHNTTMTTTSPTKTKKLSLTEQLKNSRDNENKLAIQLKEESTRAYNAEQEVRNVLVKKDKEMKDILNHLLTPIAVHENSSMFYPGGMREKTVPMLAGELAGAIARITEKCNLQQTIIEESDSQIKWFRDLIEKAFGVKAKEPKVEKKEIESTAFGEWTCSNCKHKINAIGNPTKICPNCNFNHKTMRDLK